MVEVPLTGEGVTDSAALAAAVDDSTFAVAVQSPNYLGLVEDWNAGSKTARAHGALSRRIEARRSTLLKPATVAANLGAESTDAFLRDDRNHHQASSRIHLPPTEQRIQQQATQEIRGKVATEVGLF